MISHIGGQSGLVGVVVAAAGACGPPEAVAAWGCRLYRLAREKEATPLLVLDEAAAAASASGLTRERSERVSGRRAPDHICLSKGVKRIAATACVREVRAVREGADEATFASSSPTYGPNSKTLLARCMHPATPVRT